MNQREVADQVIAGEQTIMAIAAHVSRRMVQRHSDIGLEAKRTAVLAALSQRGNEGGLCRKERHKNSVRRNASAGMRFPSRDLSRSFRLPVPVRACFIPTEGVLGARRSSG